MDFGDLGKAMVGCAVMVFLAGVSLGALAVWIYYLTHG